jgi:hypothetical protein
LPHAHCKTESPDNNTIRQQTIADTGEGEMNESLSVIATSVVKTGFSGYDLLNKPGLNKGTAFTEHERDTFGLHGLLPSHKGTLEDQLERRLKAFENQTTNFGRYSFMRDLQDSNETLFYALITHNVEKLLPVVYTPGVGEQAGSRRGARRSG